MNSLLNFFLNLLIASLLLPQWVKASCEEGNPDSYDCFTQTDFGHFTPQYWQEWPLKFEEFAQTNEKKINECGTSGTVTTPELAVAAFTVSFSDQRKPSEPLAPLKFISRSADDKTDTVEFLTPAFEAKACSMGCGLGFVDSKPLLRRGIKYDKINKKLHWLEFNENGKLIKEHPFYGLRKLKNANNLLKNINAPCSTWKKLKSQAPAEIKKRSEPPPLKKVKTLVTPPDTFRGTR